MTELEVVVEYIFSYLINHRENLYNQAQVIMNEHKAFMSRIRSLNTQKPVRK